MKIVFVPDVLDWAIGGLVQAKVKNMPYHDIKVIPIHPRDAVEKARDFYNQIEAFKPDIIVYEYFRSCAQLIEAQPGLKDYTSILVHHNQRDKALFFANWNDLGIDMLVTHTEKCKTKLVDKGYQKVQVINHGIDLDRFTYNDKEPEIPMIGYVGRIVPWKGLKELSEVAQELGYPVQVMGKQDSAEYWDSVTKEPLRFEYFDCPNDEVANAYRTMTIYVGNSQDNYEEGTLPFLEALASGVPVVTTPNGVAADIIQDRVNGLIVPFGDKEALKSAVKELMEDKELRNELRKNGWQTVKNMPQEKMAYEYAKLFDRLHYKKTLVSVIIPSTEDRAGRVKEILHALDASSYDSIEAIVAWDEPYNKASSEFSKLLTADLDRLTVKQVFTGADGYNLARARNLAAIEATGEFILFCDSRLKPELDAVEVFMTVAETNSKKKLWYFGNKGSGKRSFVENFSLIRRTEFIEFGMMCERIDHYGGMSQELRTRWIKQGGDFQYVDSAMATEMLTSGMTQQKRHDIVAMKLRLLKMYQGENH